MDDLAPGYTRISGKRKPPASWGPSLYVQLRNGHCPDEPWPVGSTKSGQTRWVWDGIAPDFDIVAVRKA